MSPWVHTGGAQLSRCTYLSCRNNLTRCSITGCAKIFAVFEWGDFTQKLVEYCAVSVLKHLHARGGSLTLVCSVDAVSIFWIWSFNCVALNTSLTAVPQLFVEVNFSPLATSHARMHPSKSERLGTCLVCSVSATSAGSPRSNTCRGTAVPRLSMTSQERTVRPQE